MHTGQCWLGRRIWNFVSSIGGVTSNIFARNEEVQEAWPPRESTHYGGAGACGGSSEVARE
jgi:hypothetical protein